jgi:single-strand DNA-binding protein
MTLKVTVIGNLTKDAVMRNTQSGDSVLNFSIARNDRRTQEVTFIDATIWGKLAQSLEPYLKKGQKVYVDGDLGKREYEGRTYLTCRVRDIELVGGRQQNEYDQSPQSDQSYDRGLDDEIPF